MLTTPTKPANGPSASSRVLVLVCAAFLYTLLGSATAQATWQVESLIPEVLSLRTPTTSIAFSLDSATYPPKEFPATYLATEPEGGVLPVQVFSNAEGVWSLTLEVPDLLSVEGVAVLGAESVLYRVNEGLWLRADGTPQVIYTQSGPTLGWLELRLEFALELTGAEEAGDYVVEAVVSALREPGF